MGKLGVGEPAGSSLSSCLCAFPGGVSLLTETGLLRPFLVSDKPSGGSATGGNTDVVAAAPFRLSEPSPEGAFPVGTDVPVDHAWSQDGSVVVVLCRSSFAAYWRDPEATEAAVESRGQNAPLVSRRCPSKDERVQDGGSGERTSRRIPASGDAPSLGLAEVHRGSNGFEGKVVACCFLGSHATATATSASINRSGNRWTYLIAVGGSAGVECHALELRKPPEDIPTEERKRCLSEGRQDVNAGKPTAGCRPLVTIFQGYPVVAVALSPDTSLMAAAAMTGHVKVWEVGALVATAPPPPRTTVPVPTMKETAAHDRSGGKRKESDDALRAMQPTPGRGDSSDLAALWGVALSMARVTSLSFSPDDNSTFALACWDGKVALFLPNANAEAVVRPTTPIRIGAPTKGGCGASQAIGSNRAWKHVWRVAPAAATAKAGGGKRLGNLEDQDGAFLCWCKGSNTSRAHLTVSTYCVTTGDCSKKQCREGEDPDERASTSSGTTVSYPPPPPPPPPPNISGEYPLREAFHEAYPSVMATAAPGCEVFAGGGLGERIGGVVSGSRPAGLRPEPTAERYLIHGLAAGPSFVALYDSELCLHVISIAAIVSAGCVLPALPSPPHPIAAMEASSMVAHPAEISPGVAEAGASTSPPSTIKVTLVSNDHGLIAACVRRHSGPEDGGSDHATPLESGLELEITWRNAISGEETPDDGGCVGQGAGQNDRGLSFLPHELTDNETGCDDESGGVFGADIRWGCFALFTRYTALVYTRPSSQKAARRGQGVVKGGNARAEGSTGGWRAYAEHPIVHGLLLGGASTAVPLSQRLPKPPADLTGIYLLTVLGAEGDDGPVLSIRSLRDRSITCRCPLSASGDDIKEADVSTRHPGLRVYVSPGYGGGVFVAAAEGGDRECARVWRGTFDEGSCRLEVGPPRVITSYPWPEPDTMRLQGVAGPNCELFLFKEVEGGSNSTNQNVRWWLTWPEVEIWRWVDAPGLLGEEDLGVSDFVKIFQLEVESMMSLHTRPGEEEN